MTKPVLYVVACGARPAADLPAFVTWTQDQGWDTCVVVTPFALRFADTAGLAELTGHPVRSDYKRPEDPDVLPPADAFAVAPCTFNTLNKWANGISDTLALGLLNEARAAVHRSPPSPTRTPSWPGIPCSLGAWRSCVSAASRCCSTPRGTRCRRRTWGKPAATCSRGTRSRAWSRGCASRWGDHPYLAVNARPLSTVSREVPTLGRAAGGTRRTRSQAHGRLRSVAFARLVTDAEAALPGHDDRPGPTGARARHLGLHSRHRLPQGSLSRSGPSTLQEVSKCASLQTAE